MRGKGWDWGADVRIRDGVEYKVMGNGKWNGAENSG